MPVAPPGSPGTSGAPGTSRAAGRRSRALVPVAATLSVVLLAPACAGPPGGSGTAADFRLSRSTPAAKGRLDSFSWALYAEPSTLDPVSAFDYPHNMILSNVCESLMRWTPDLRTVPGLARKATRRDARTWVYDLRAGVRFHSGRVMTADDVVASLGRHRDPANGSAWAQVFENVASVKKTGALQVTVRLERPDSQFPQYMATAAGAVADRSRVREAGKDYGTSGGLGCTGPYKLGNWDKGQSIELRRFGRYWGRNAKSAKVLFRFITDSSARTKAMLSGEVDGGYLIPTESYAALRRSGAGTLHFGEGLSTVNVNVTSMRGPLRDVRVRRALSLALDRRGFVHAGLGGAGTATGSLTTKAAWAGAPAKVRRTAFTGLPPLARDLKKARKLVREAGAEGRTLTIATSSIGQDVSLLATAVQSAGSRIGLKVALKTVAPNAYSALFTDPEARKGLDMFPETYYESITDPLDLLSNFRTGAYQNYAGYSDRSYDRLVDRARATYEPGARMALVSRLQHKAAGQFLWIPVAEWPTALFLNKRITGAPTTISYLYYPWAADVGAAR